VTVGVPGFKVGVRVGVYWGDVRPRGSLIQSGANGASEGVIPFMHIQDSVTLATNQGSVRRGASAAYLPIEHGDAEEFIRMRKPSGDINRQNLNIHHGVTIGDDFMRSLTDSSHVKHKHNRTLWLELLKTRLETGEPYIMFRDTVNNNTPDCYKKNNLKVETSNLCLSGDTKVLTQSFDLVPIKDLVGREVSIFDGENWTLNSSFRKTQDSAILYRIRLSSGSYVDATDNHRWFVKVDDSLLEKRTISLQVGDSLETSIYSKHESIKILSIEKLEGTHEVYCTTVPSTTKFALANGLMTGNCSEILLHTDNDNSFVCCLSSVNLDKYDEWKNDSMFIKDCIWFLDAVIEEFIDKASSIEGFERAISFAKNSRALGLGVLGYHSLLQRKSLPFDSFESMMLNSEIFRKLQTESLAGSRELALMYGEPEWCKGFGIRNSHQLAIAPTATNSVISGGVSPGIEPIIANAFLQKTAKGVFLKKNPSLVTVLEKYGKNDEDVWKDIAVTGGSVQHLDFLSELEKEVFKTAYEINQVAIIKQAASRQKYIDQGQSLNIFVPHNIDAKLYHLLHMEAWKSGVKTLYYSRATSALSGHSVASNINLNECKACEG
jgi:ribonucleotide reductase alpha subunit